MKRKSAFSNDINGFTNKKSRNQLNPNQKTTKKVSFDFPETNNQQLYEKYLFFGDACYNRGIFDSAEHNYDIAILVAESAMSLTKNPDDISNAKFNAGVACYYSLNQFHKVGYYIQNNEILITKAREYLKGTQLEIKVEQLINLINAGDLYSRLSNSY